MQDIYSKPGIHRSRFPRWARATASIVLLVVLAIWLPWRVVNAMARRTWLETQALFQREGETLDFRALLSRPVPEEQNFCAAPRLLGLAAPPGQAAPHAEEGRRNAEAIRGFLSVKVFGVKPSGVLTGRRFSLEETAGKMITTTGVYRFEPEKDPEQAQQLLKEAVEKSEPLFAELATRLNCVQSQWDP